MKSLAFAFDGQRWRWIGLCFRSYSSGLGPPPEELCIALATAAPSRRASLAISLHSPHFRWTPATLALSSRLALSSTL